MFGDQEIVGVPLRGHAVAEKPVEELLGENVLIGGKRDARLRFDVIAMPLEAAHPAEGNRRAVNRKVQNGSLRDCRRNPVNPSPAPKVLQHRGEALNVIK